MTRVARRRRPFFVTVLAAGFLVAALAVAAPSSASSASSGATASASGQCPKTGTVSAKLVPSCGAWWGVSPGGSGSIKTAVASFENQTGARTDVYHGYHRLGDLFPTNDEIALARDPQGHRYLLLSLLTSNRSTTWRDVANGKMDGYLDQLATRIKTTYREPFFLTLHHEPENDVIPAAGSGMQATDFAAMFRHVVTRIRDTDKVGNVVWVINYQGTQKFKTESWWPSMYPGDDVVDWIGWDSYSCVKPAPGQPCNDFAQMMNRRFSDTSPWLGMYSWAHTHHPTKPIFVCELGVYDVGGTRKADALRTVAAQISRFPQVKAVSYWNSGTTRKAQVDIGQGALAASATMAQSPWFAQSVP
ncbi:MAG: glycosyl hydrolase [Lapillicoccus sp.]